MTLQKTTSCKHFKFLTYLGLLFKSKSKHSHLKYLRFLITEAAKPADYSYCSLMTPSGNYWILFLDRLPVYRVFQKFPGKPTPLVFMLNRFMQAGQVIKRGRQVLDRVGAENHQPFSCKMRMSTVQCLLFMCSLFSI